jgi:hypothetical protein
MITDEELEAMSYDELDELINEELNEHHKMMQRLRVYFNTKYNDMIIEGRKRNEKTIKTK